MSSRETIAFDYRGNQITISAEELQSVTNFTRALNHDIRASIINLLSSRGELGVTDIYRALSIEQSIASQQLRILWRAGVVTDRRDSKYVFYQLNRPRLVAVARVIKLLAS